jgi:PKHD-type hydroxylase
MNSVVEIKEFLTKDECHSIIKFSLENLQMESAEIFDKKGNTTLNEKIRKSKVAFHEFNKNFEWLTDRLNKLINTNILVKGHSINVNDILQFTKYEVGEHYEWHTDTDKNETASDRAYSIVIQLSDNYLGGDLEYHENDVKSFNKGVGNLFIFPSHYPHRVTKIEDGIRYSLVGWFSLSKDLEYKKSIF